MWAFTSSRVTRFGAKVAVETHCSLVFLACDRADKLKRAAKVRLTDE
jgi:aminoglycoside phosphotransferase family enzyme